MSGSHLSSADLAPFPCTPELLWGPHPVSPLSQLHFTFMQTPQGPWPRVPRKPSQRDVGVGEVEGF